MSAALVGEVCLARNWRLAVAESCTGGLLGGALTSVPGSSAWFVGGVIAYADGLKVGMLGVERSLLAAHGAVSEPVARTMARGARAATGADAAIAVTGVAGPGASSAKPAGTVFIAVSLPEREVARLCSFAGDRAAVRAQAVEAALALFLAAAAE
jgi:nicotinamide-nucleotide amidase